MAIVTFGNLGVSGNPQFNSYEPAGRDPRDPKVSSPALADVGDALADLGAFCPIATSDTIAVPRARRKMAYVVLFAGHDPDLLGRWENLLFAAGFEVVSATDPAEPLHAILCRASELEQLGRSMQKEERPLGLVMRMFEPCAPVVMIADHGHVHYLDLGELADGIPEEIVAALRRSLSA